MNKNRLLSVLGAAACATTLGAVLVSAAGPNLAKNGDFSIGTDHWKEYPGVADNMTIDAGTGALEVAVTSHTSGGYAVSAIQCIEDIKPDTQYLFEADAFIPAGQGRTGYANLYAFGYSEEECDGYSPGSPGSQDLTTLDSWTHLSDSFVPPAGSKSVMFTLRVEMQEAGAGEDSNDEFRALFDNASFTEEGPAQEPPAFWPDYQGPPEAPEPDPEPPSPAPEPPVVMPPLPETDDQVPTPTPTPPAADPPAPSQPQQPEASDEPSSDPVPTAETPTVEDVAGATPEAPLPPSTGNGRASTEDNGPRDSLIGAALMALGGLATAGSLAWRKAGNRTR